MSTYDPIDLDAIKQAFFRENLPDFFNYSYFWVITDQNGNVLSSSSNKRTELTSKTININQKFNNLTNSSIELVIDPIFPIAVALEVVNFKVTINSQSVNIKVFNKIKNTNIKFRVFGSDFFIREDRFDNNLNFSESVSTLEFYRPWEKLTEHEWTVAWLIIHRLTNPEIAGVTNKSVYTIKDTVERILGTKLKLFDRYLLSDVGLYLNWDCYIPLSLIKDTV